MKDNIAFKILVYSGAIDQLKHNPYGFCGALRYAADRIAKPNTPLLDTYTDKGMGKLFPEIHKHKPINNKWNMWEGFTEELRIKVLEDEIETLFKKL